MCEWFALLAASQADVLTYLATIAIVAATIVAVVYIVQWGRLRRRKAELQAALQRTELETSLKQELLAHGLSPDEIKQVIEATSAELP
jgi:hypothetical protein